VFILVCDVIPDSGTEEGFVGSINLIPHSTSVTAFPRISAASVYSMVYSCPVLILWPARSEPRKRFGDEQEININGYVDGLYNYIIYDQLELHSMLFSNRVGDWRLRRYWMG
jgi:hypothetical protein